MHISRHGCCASTPYIGYVMEEGMVLICFDTDQATLEFIVNDVQLSAIICSQNLTSMVVACVFICLTLLFTVLENS